MTPDTTSAEPTLSVVLVGRNDDYGGSFKRRLSNTLNCLAAVAERTGTAAEVEVVLVDFGSEPGATLADRVLDVSDAARAMTRVILVPPAVVAKHKHGPADTFNGSLAHNIGTRRARGRFVLLTAADTLVPELSCHLLFSLFRGTLPVPDHLDVARTLFLCPYFYNIASEFWRRDDFVQTVLRTFFYRLTDPPAKWANAAGGGYGAFLAHRDLLTECRGLDESYCYWGGSDTELYIRLARRVPWIATGSLGIAVAHQQHVETGGRRTGHITIHNDFGANDENWGLPDDLFAETAIAATVISEKRRATTPFVGGLSFVDAKRGDPELLLIRRFVQWFAANIHLSAYLEIGYRLGSDAIAQSIAEQCRDATLHLVIDRPRLLRDDVDCDEVNAITVADYSKRQNGFLGHSDTLFMDSGECLAFLDQLRISAPNSVDLIVVNMNEWTHDELFGEGRLQGVLAKDGGLVVRCGDPARLERALHSLARDEAGDRTPVRLGASTAIVMQGAPMIDVDGPLDEALSTATILTYDDLADLDMAIAGRRVLVFGAGALGQRLKRDLDAIGVPVERFLDSDQRTWGRVIDGLIVGDPAAIDRSSSVVVVASAWYTEICEQLVERDAVRDGDVLVWLGQYGPTESLAANQR